MEHEGEECGSWAAGQTERSEPVPVEIRLKSVVMESLVKTKLGKIQ